MKTVIQNNSTIHKKLFLTASMLVGIVSVSGSNQAFVDRSTPVEVIEVEQSLDSLYKILNYVELKENTSSTSTSSHTTTH